VLGGGGGRGRGGRRRGGGGRRGRGRGGGRGRRDGRGGGRRRGGAGGDGTGGAGAAGADGVGGGGVVALAGGVVGADIAPRNTPLLRFRGRTMSREDGAVTLGFPRSQPSIDDPTAYIWPKMYMVLKELMHCNCVSFPFDVVSSFFVIMIRYT